MSCWTYVTGVIEVDTCARSDAEAMYLAQTVVNHLPRITVSMHPAKAVYHKQLKRSWNPTTLRARYDLLSLLVAIATRLQPLREESQRHTTVSRNISKCRP